MIYHDIPMMNGSCPKRSEFITRYYKHDNNHIRRFSKYGCPKMINFLKKFHLPFWGTSIFIKPINYSYIYHKPYLTYVVICYNLTDISCLTMAPPNPSVSHLSPHTDGAVASSPSDADSVITTAWGIKSQQWRINSQKMSFMLI